MTQEDKQLLLVDLCARLPYKVVAQVTYKDSEGWKTEDRKVLGAYAGGQVYVDCVYTNIENVKPYLRPMSSMTEDEREEYSSFVLREYDGYLTDGMPDYTGKHYVYIDSVNIFIDWLNEHHFDYRGLIPKGLAIPVTEENNPYKRIKL